MGPDMRGLDHSWVPLHLAIGWIFTRDRDFVGKLPFDGSTRKVAVAIAIQIEMAKGTKAKPIDDSWLDLRDAMLTGKVRAQGIPYWRRPRDGGFPVETAEVRRDIPAAEIADANLRDDNEYRDCLIPKDWHVSSAPFYRNIQVLRANLLAVFRPPAPTTKDEAGAITALANLLREGPKLRRAEARRNLAAEGFNISDRRFLNRIWPQARLEAGLEALAPAGRPAVGDASSQPPQSRR
ncbi:hypothetical protein [Bradyrhizobium sp.]|uniref:hypothetical protein n=1 Tax=Bradyrhizobium sp. TaxID=376 RepID=UPI003C733ACF